MFQIDEHVFGTYSHKGIHGIGKAEPFSNHRNTTVVYTLNMYNKCSCGTNAR